MNHMVNAKKFLIGTILMVLEIKQSSIARELHLSKSQIGRLIAGEQNNPQFNDWVVAQVKRIFI